MSTNTVQRPTPRLPLHQRTAQALTFATLSAAVILGPFYASALIIAKI